MEDYKRRYASLDNKNVFYFLMTAPTVKFLKQVSKQYVQQLPVLKTPVPTNSIQEKYITLILML